MDKATHFILMALMSGVMRHLLLLPRQLHFAWVYLLMIVGFVKEYVDWQTHPSSGTPYPEIGRMLFESFYDSCFNFAGITLGLLLSWLFAKSRLPRAR